MVKCRLLVERQSKKREQHIWESSESFLSAKVVLFQLKEFGWGYWNLSYLLNLGRSFFELYHFARFLSISYFCRSQFSVISKKKEERRFYASFRSSA